MDLLMRNNGHPLPPPHQILVCSTPPIYWPAAPFLTTLQAYKTRIKIKETNSALCISITVCYTLQMQEKGRLCERVASLSLPEGMKVRFPEIAIIHFPAFSTSLTSPSHLPIPVYLLPNP